MPSISVQIILIICILLTHSDSIKAQKKTDLNPTEATISVSAYDKETNEPIPYAKFSIKEIKKDDEEGEKSSGSFPVMNPTVMTIRVNNEKYLLSVFAEIDESNLTRIIMYDYEPQTFIMDFTKNRPGDENQTFNAYLSKVKETALNEVSVTASRVKFYYKGDTLVYNASAFITPEGSMLDALLYQIPDIKLTESGEIFHKGKRIETLLLNGKDLFDNNRNLMIRNIGAYTVRDLNLYTQTGRDSELLGHDIGDSKYVMNVRLKKQYSHGFSINSYIGGGTHGRYSERMFGMWFSDNVSLSAYAGMDNVSSVNDRKYSPSQFARSEFNGAEGQKKSHYAGVEYSANSSNPTWKITGNVRYSDTRPFTEKSQMSVNFLHSGDTYSYLWSNFRNHIRSISTSHTAEFTICKKVNMSVSPSVSHSENDSRYSFLNATLNREITENALATVENIYAGGSEALADMLNRSRNLSLQTERKTSGSLIARSLFSTGSKSWMEFNAESKASKTFNEKWQLQEIGYGCNNPYVSTLRRNFKYTPDWNRNVIASALWKKTVWEKKSNIGIGYYFSDFRQRYGRTLFGENHPGMFPSDSISWNILPSMTHNLPEIASQGYISDLEKQSHKLTFSSFLDKETDSYQANISFKASLLLGRRNLRYRRGTTPHDVAKKDLLPDMTISGSYELKGERINSISLSFSSDENSPSLFNVIDIVDDTDPLNIYIGNPDLRNYRNFNASLSFWSQSHMHSWNHNWEASCQFTKNANARGYYYNTQTGVRTYRTYNIDGNFSTSAYYRITKHFHIKPNPIVRNIVPLSETTLTFSRNVDLVGATTDTEPDLSVAPPKSSVRILSLHENLSFDIDITSNATLMLTATFDIRSFLRSDPNLNSFTSKTAHYDAYAVVKLPGDASIQSDIGIFTRRGFNDPLLNTSDVIWNASIAKSIMKQTITFTLSATDILRQLRTVYYTINAQAKTETVTNSIPSYVMLTLLYKFNKQPHKKKTKKS